MSDLISRKEAIQKMIDLYEEDVATYGCSIPECFDCDRATDALRALPSAQKTGRWINKPNIYGVAYCSECDYELHTNDTNFCPNCGAYMTGSI